MSDTTPPTTAGSRPQGRRSSTSATSSAPSWRIYGVILTLAGLLGEHEPEKTGGVNANLWTGLALLVVGAFFIGWARLKPDRRARARRGARRRPDAPGAAAQAPARPLTRGLGSPHGEPRRTSTSWSVRSAASSTQRLAEVDADLARHYPGGRPGRQPVHTVYVPADRFRADLVDDVRRHRPARDRGARGRAPVPARRRRRPARPRPRQAGARAGRGRPHRPRGRLRLPSRRRGGRRRRARGRRAAAALADGAAPAWCGIRFKSFEAPTRRRGIRTLDAVPRAPRRAARRCPTASW